MDPKRDKDSTSKEYQAIPMDDVGMDNPDSEEQPQPAKLNIVRSEAVDIVSFVEPEELEKLYPSDNLSSTLLLEVVEFYKNKDTNVHTVTNGKNRTILEQALIEGYYKVVNILTKIDSPKFEMPKKIDLLCDVIIWSEEKESREIGRDYEQCCTILLDQLLGTLKNQRENSEFKVQEYINKQSETTENTPLRYALHFAKEHIIVKILNLGASFACKNTYGTMDIEAIKPDVLERYLDLCIGVKDKDLGELDMDQFENENLRLSFNCQNLVPPHFPTKQETIRNTPETEVINFMSKTPKFQDLLAHPVVFTFLIMKWKYIKWLFLFISLVYFLFCIFLVLYIFTSSLTYFIIVCICFLVLALFELFQIVIKPLNYIKKFENYVKLLIFTNVIILWFFPPACPIGKEAGALAILLSAIELALILELQPIVSRHVHLLKSITVIFFKLLLWYLLVILTFALCFNILFADASDDENFFNEPYDVFIKMMMMITGGLEGTSSGFDRYPFASMIIFSLFVVIVIFILMNLVTSLAVDDIQKMSVKADFMWCISAAQHIYHVETMLLGCSFLRKLVNKMCVFESSDSCKLFANKKKEIFLKKEPEETKSVVHWLRKLCWNVQLNEKMFEKIKNISEKLKKKKKNSEESQNGVGSKPMVRE